MPVKCGQTGSFLRLLIVLVHTEAGQWPPKALPIKNKACFSILTRGLSRAKSRLGRTSGTPPTRVETTSSPAAAASTSAMQNASVSEVFRKMRPRRSTPGTCASHTQPYSYALIVSHLNTCAAAGLAAAQHGPTLVCLGYMRRRGKA